MGLRMPTAAQRDEQRALQREQAAFEAEVADRLRERARLLLTGETQVLQTLAEARAQIMTMLAELPADWQQWQLSRLLGQINDVLDAATSKAGTLFGATAQDAWRMGEDMVDKPLAAIGYPVEMQLPMLNVVALKQMRVFSTLRLKDVGVEASRKIGQQLGLVTLGAVTPAQAIKVVSALLGGADKRAATVVRTGASQLFAVAAHERLVQAAKLVPGMGKRWRRSSKIHSRWHHDLMDGQVVEDPEKPFKVPNPGGGVDMMLHPHDPKAPPEQVINCGCIVRGWKKGWKLATPGAKPFTELELKLDGRKAALDQDAKRAGRRLE